MHGVDGRCVDSVLALQKYHRLLFHVLVQDRRADVHLVLLEPFSNFSYFLFLRAVLTCWNFHWHFDSAVDVAAFRAKRRSNEPLRQYRLILPIDLDREANCGAEVAIRLEKQADDHFFFVSDSLGHLKRGVVLRICDSIWAGWIRKKLDSFNPENEVYIYVLLVVVSWVIYNFAIGKILLTLTLALGRKGNIRKSMSEGWMSHLGTWCLSQRLEEYCFQVALVECARA